MSVSASNSCLVQSSSNVSVSLSFFLSRSFLWRHLDSLFSLVFLLQVTGKPCTYWNIFAVTQNCFQRKLTSHTRKWGSKLLITRHFGPQITLSRHIICTFFSRLGCVLRENPSSARGCNHDPIRWLEPSWAMSVSLWEMSERPGVAAVTTVPTGMFRFWRWIVTPWQHSINVMLCHCDDCTYLYQLQENLFTYIHIYNWIFSIGVLIILPWLK